MKDFSAYVGLPEKEAYALALQQSGWKFDEPSKMILPQKLVKADDQPIPAQVQLNTLTDFVAFMER